jgi:hypothetical protein
MITNKVKNELTALVDVELLFDAICDDWGRKVRASSHRLLLNAVDPRPEVVLSVLWI